MAAALVNPVCVNGTAARCQGRTSRHGVACAAQTRTVVVNRKAALPTEQAKNFGYKREMPTKYEVQDMIGAGTFGSVHEAVCRRTGKMFAVKTITKRFTGEFIERHFLRRVRHEVDIYMCMGNSLNVATLYDVFEDDTRVHLIMEHCGGGELWKRIRKHDYTELEAARIVREVIRTVSQFHANGIVLRDVKPENWMFSDTERTAQLKAIDFGIAEYCGPEDTLQERAGTPIYVAPEVLKQRYGQKADLWSAGILAYQLLSGHLPFAGDSGLAVSKAFMTKQVWSNKDVFRAVLYADLDFTSSPWDELSPDAKHLVASLLTRDPEMRPTAAEVLKHPWFLDLDDEVPQTPRADGLAANADLAATVVQRLQRFGTYGRLKQVALRGIAGIALSVAGNEGQLREIEAAFRGMDPEGAGRVPYSAVLEYLKAGQFDLSDIETEQLVYQMGTPENGFVQYDEWLAAMVEWQALQQSSEWDAWVGAAFDQFNGDGSGFMGESDLAAMLCKDGQCAMPDIVQSALRDADVDADGSISLDDFGQLVQENDRDNLNNFPSRRLQARA